MKNTLGLYLLNLLQVTVIRLIQLIIRLRKELLFCTSHREIFAGYFSEINEIF
jgi:hypothetical protein